MPTWLWKRIWTQGPKIYIKMHFNGTSVDIPTIDIVKLLMWLKMNSKPNLRNERADN